MASLKISPSMLAEALAEIVKRQSAGMADTEVTAIYAVATTGDLFEINGLEIELAPKRAPAPTPSKFTPPAGFGKIRLATVNGVQAS